MEGNRSIRRLTRLVLALAALWTQQISAQEGRAEEGGETAPTDGGSEVASEVASAEATAKSEAVVRLERELIDDFVGAYGKESLESMRPQLRALMTRLDAWLVAKVPDLAERRAARAAARAHLHTSLAAANSADSAQVKVAVDKASKFDHQRREGQILGDLMCWCPRPACNFTRTVAACPDPCAQEQKGMVNTWLREGLSDEEIIGRMVAHPKGGPRVHTTPNLAGAQSVGFFLPLVLGALTGVVVLFFLSRSASRGRELAAAGAGGQGGVGAGGPLGSGSARALGDGDDARWQNEIERELKEMDD